MMYYSDVQTEQELARLEKTIKGEYTKAYKELRVKTAEYFESFAVRDAQMKKAIEDSSYPIPTGYTPDQYYKLWRKNQLGRGKRWEKLRDDMAERIGRSNEIAAAYINDATPGIYSLNYNYEAYMIEGITGASFDIYNEQTVKQLVKGENHIEFRTVSVDPVRDYAWNTKKINSALTSGILQGKSIKGLTDSFMTVMKTNRTAAIRNARTAVTSAQNGGRQESYNRASDMGIEIEKEWMAIIDGATRDSHMQLDGVIVPHDEPFPNGLMYPGDPAGTPKEVYNCRCTLTARLPKYSNYSLAKGSRTGNDAVSYRKWVNDKKNTEKSSESPLNNGKITVIKGHKGAPKNSEPNAIIDHIGKNEKVETRSYYDSDGWKQKDITTHDHGSPAAHPYGKHGEHAHDYEWNADGSLKTRTTRELTEQERKQNKDLL